LAGQPQEPSWQSPAQDQARPAWQPSPPPPDNNQGAYGYPQSTGAQGAQGYGQSYSPPGQGYAGPSYTAPETAVFPGQDQAYPGQDQAYPGQDQGYPGQDQGYPGPQGQSAPQWQAAPGMPGARARGKATGDAKGFVGALFDFSFTSFVTPKIIKVLYVLITAWTVIWALIFLRLGFKYGGAAGGFFTLIIVDPILVLLTLGVYRVVLELFMVVHRMHEDLKAIRDRGEDRV
jgi:uncharacterized membrane protein